MSNEAGCSHRSLPQFRRHGRNWRENRYVYPVLSRRSGGLSIGINLNPDKACNFDCVYCQVDRTTPPRVREVDPDALQAELAEMLEAARSGAIFAEPEFSSVPAALRRVCDIAFSGDGEPTTCKHFKECVQIAAELKRRFA
ncbi:MAG: radical SAM protein, partial [Planctomycetota bacterium]